MRGCSKACPQISSECDTKVAFSVHFLLNSQNLHGWLTVGVTGKARNPYTRLCLSAYNFSVFEYHA